MDENKHTAVETPAAASERDKELFDAIGKNKKKKRVRRIIVTLVILALLGSGIAAGVSYGRRKVKDKFVDQNAPQVVAYTVDTGSVNTTVSGSGQLSDVDTEKLTVPEGVKVDEVLVAAGQRVEQGDLLATVESASVLKAMSDTQAKIGELDVKLRNASRDAVSGNLNAGVGGRVKAVYAQKDDDVAACMIRHGALALMSIDGYMAADITTDALKAGDEVKILRAEGKPLPGTVERVNLGVATVLVTDNGPMLDETVTVQDAEGSEIGTGVLYIHNPLKITGFAGTISFVNAAENKYVNAGSNLFVLKDTAYTANYEAVLKERREMEDRLVELLAVYRAGAIQAPFAGTVSSVDYKDPSEADNSQSNAQQPSDADLYGEYAGYMTGADSAGEQSGQSETKTSSALVTLSTTSSAAALPTSCQRACRRRPGPGRGPAGPGHRQFPGGDVPGHGDGDQPHGQRQSGRHQLQRRHYHAQGSPDAPGHVRPGRGADPGRLRRGADPRGGAAPEPGFRFRLYGV